MSSLITPATLSVELKPNITSMIVHVRSPSINNMDYNTSRNYELSGKLQRTFETIAMTGEQLPFPPPNNLRNSSYTIDMFVPSVRCHESNATVRSLTANAAYRAILKEGAIGSAQNTLTKNTDYKFFPENMAVFGRQSHYISRIGYYASTSDLIIVDSLTDPNTYVSTDPELWIVLANPPKGFTWTRETFTSPSTLFPLSFFTCVLRNASVEIDVSFSDSVSSVHTKVVQEAEYYSPVGKGISTDQLSVVLAACNFQRFAEAIFDFFEGLVGYHERGGDTGIRWSTTIDQTIFATAKDFANMATTFDSRAEYLDPDAVVQEKNLTAMIEEFSLNASLSLMAIPSYR